METKLTLLNLYQAIVDDCKITIKKNAGEDYFNKMSIQVKQDLKGLISFFRGVLHNSSFKGNVQTFAIGYLDTVLQNIEQQKYEELSEDELYLANAFLFSFNYLNGLSKIDEIKKFNYESYKNFYEILKSFGGPEKLKENYENFGKKLMEENTDKKTVKTFLQNLEKKKLTKKAHPEAVEKNDKRKRRMKIKNMDSDGQHNSNVVEIQKEEEKKDENETINNIENNSNQNELNINIAPAQTKESQILITNNETNSENNHNNTNILINEGKNLGNNFMNKENNINNIVNDNFINDVNNKIERIQLNNDNNISKEKSINHNKINEKANENNMTIKSDSDNNNNKEETSAEDIKIKLENNNESDYLKKEIIINNLNNNIKKENEITNKDANKEEKIEEKHDEELDINENISYKDLVKIVLNTNKKLKETQKKLSETQTELSQTNKKLNETQKEFLTRIEKLEKNQKLIFCQISMYHSRDISKNIYYYFAKELNIKNQEKPFFDLKEIMHYLKNNQDQTKYSKEEKTNLRKFFKILFFVNKVNSRALHNNLPTRLQNEINEYKTKENDDLLSLLPPTSFDQLFESLSFYVENNAKDQQIQKVMKHVYENEYINDKELNDIKDDDKEVIQRENDESIKLQITKEEINKAKSIFLNIKDFALDCELKTYG